MILKFSWLCNLKISANKDQVDSLLVNAEWGLREKVPPYAFWNTDFIRPDLLTDNCWLHAGINESEELINNII